MLFAVGDLVWIALIGCAQAVMIMIGGIVSVIVQKWEAKKVAEKVKEVKETCDVSTQQAHDDSQELKCIAQDTHSLVNSQMRAQLKLTADLSKWKAITTNDPVDIQAAKLAEKKLLEHDEQQAKIDAEKQAKIDNQIVI